MGASMIEELEQIIFHNHQPDDHSTNFLKNLRKEFDCMRFLRILAKVRDYETKLDHKRKALRSMPVQSDHPDIAAARKTFVGDDKLFLMHFNRHYKELSDYTESRRKLLSYHQEIANLFPDAYRYFHSLYVDSNSVSDAYEKFDERVDKQIKKLFIKIQKLKLDESLEHILKLSLQQSQKGKGSATVFDMETPLSPQRSSKPTLKSNAELNSSYSTTKSASITEMILKNRTSSSPTKKSKTSDSFSKKSSSEDNKPAKIEKQTSENNKSDQQQNGNHNNSMEISQSQMDDIAALFSEDRILDEEGITYKAQNKEKKHHHKKRASSEDEEEKLMITVTNDKVTDRKREFSKSSSKRSRHSSANNSISKKSSKKQQDSSDE